MRALDSSTDVGKQHSGRERFEVLTMALGKSHYFDLACNFARSFWLHHGQRSVRFRIVTDGPVTLPRDLVNNCEIEQIVPGELGVGFTPKLNLDRFLTEFPLLFIDADVLVYSSLVPLWERLAGRPVAVVGKQISSGAWFGDIAEYCTALGVRSIPKFNGGLYYLEPGVITRHVYAEARRLAERYDELGLIRLRGHPNDELVIAGSLAKHGLDAVEDDGSVMSDPQACRGPMKTNVLYGSRELINPRSPSELHQPWNPFERLSPMMVHYLGSSCSSPEYRAEVLRLRLAANGLPLVLADMTARLLRLWPLRSIEIIKDAVRPIYRRFFGIRAVVAPHR